MASVPKYGKNLSSPESYRPISLLSTLGKLTKKFILIEIDQHIENNNIIIPYQFGFRKSLSAPHQVYRITEHLTQARINNQSTAALFLHIARAFDRVRIDGLIHKLITSP